MLADKLQKFIFEDLPVKGSLVHLHASWKEICLHANPDEDFTRLFAETLCTSVLLTSNIKFRGSISLQIQSQGRLALVLGQCTHERRVRGVVRVRSEHAEEPLKNPVLSINLEPADGGQPYQGIVAFPGGDLAQAVEEYFQRSEQIDTRVWLAVGDQCCSGLMLQRLPGQAIEEDAWQRITVLAGTVSDDELLSMEAGPILARLFREDAVRLFDPSPVKFGCQCSKQRVGDMLKGLGKPEVMDILDERGEVEVSCEYCGRRYRFDRVDAAHLFVSDEQLGESTPLRQ